MFPKSVRPHPKARIAALLFGLAGIGAWLMRPIPPAEFAMASASRGKRASREPTRQPSRPATAAVDQIAALPPKASRTEAAVYLGKLYRRELRSRELELEQRRYGDAYWKSERDGVELARLAEARETLRRELDDEANQVLAALYPAEEGDAVRLMPFFDDAHPGPNVSFLSSDSRTRFEAEMADSDIPDAEHLLEFAGRVLTPAEWETYRRWNEPGAAALRRQLAGFNATETEFIAILKDGRGAADVDDDIGISSGLEARLGAQRYAEFARFTDPAIQTAVAELRRFGLPLEHAEWLAAKRREAAAAMQEIWQNPLLAPGTKQEKVALVQRAYSQDITARLHIAGSSIDALGGMP